MISWFSVDELAEIEIRSKRGRVADSCINRTSASTHRIRARNPRFYFVNAGTKPRFLTKKGHQQSGIPCSASHHGMLLSCVIFVRT